LRSREFDLDKEEKLTRAEKLANQALEILKDAPKPNPQVTDEQWAQGKKEYMAEAHQALGYAAQTRKKYDLAMSEMQTAVEQAPDQVTMVKLAQVYNINNKPDEALAMLDKLNSIPDIHPTIRSFAQAERVRATQLKGGAAKPPAVPQVEIKK
jgi:tetratricopeptide (TPR) repeat protein